jgi:hypothetical protein
VTTDYIDIVFDGPPGPECGRFVEVEDPQQCSIVIGNWVEREDGYWALRIPDIRTIDQLRAQLAAARDYACALDKRWIESEELIGTLQDNLTDATKRAELAEKLVEDSGYYEVELFTIAQVLDGPGLKEYQLLHQRQKVVALMARCEQAEAEVVRLKAEIGRVAVFLAIHGVEGYTITNWLDQREAKHD